MIYFLLELFRLYDNNIYISNEVFHQLLLYKIKVYIYILNDKNPRGHWKRPFVKGYTELGVI